MAVGASGNGGQLAHDAVDLLVPRLQVVKHAAALWIVKGVSSTSDELLANEQRGNIGHKRGSISTDNAALASG